MRKSNAKKWELTRVDKAKCVRLRDAIAGFTATNIRERKAIIYLLFAQSSKRDFGSTMSELRLALDMLAAGRVEDFSKWMEAHDAPRT